MVNGVFFLTIDLFIGYTTGTDMLSDGCKEANVDLNEYFYHTVAYGKSLTIDFYKKKTYQV